MVIVILAISLLIVLYYAEPGFPWHTYITIIICYFCAFGILLIIPSDIASAVVERNSSQSLDNYYNNVTFLSVLYNFFFLVILIFGSAVLVFEEYYNTDGKLTILEQKENISFDLYKKFHFLLRTTNFS